MNVYSKNEQQALEGSATRVDDVVQSGLRQINHHKRKFFLAVGVEAFVPDCLLDGTGRRWRCGERRKTARWTSVVRVQVHGVCYVVCDFGGNSGTQAAIVW